MSDKKSVFFDANILYSWNLNHLLMFFCDTGVGLIEPYWSDLVVAEAIKNIKANTGDDATSRFEQMNKAYPYANVAGYENENNVDGVDANDQHVAKAAIYIECDFLVTENYKHFKNAPSLQGNPKVLTTDSLLTAFAKNYSSESLKATALAWWHKTEAGTFDEYLAYLGQKTNGLRLNHFESTLRGYINGIGKTANQIADEILQNETKRY